MAKTRLFCTLFASTLGVAISSATLPAYAQSAAVPTDFTAVVKQKAPAVVAILTKQMIDEEARQAPDDLPLGELFRRRFGEPRVRERTALGSGFIVSPEGHIVTNNHVVDNASEIHVRFTDKTDLAAKLVGRDQSTDIAVLKIEPRPNMAVAAWGDSDKMEPGAWTIAIGSPFGLGGTVTVGVLSARARDIQAGPYDDFLQTDASINQGNSGGPLFNAAGEVIGVNTAILSPLGVNVGIGFAVPSRTAQAVADQIIRTGKVERGYLGVRLQELTTGIAQALGRSDTKGALVASVEPGSPAEKAGIKVGDVVTRADDQAIAGPRDLSRAVARTKPGSRLMLTVVRNGNTEELTVAVGRPEEDRRSRTSDFQDSDRTSKRLGLSLVPIPEAARKQLGADTTGLMVGDVEPGSPAAESGIRPGDVITTVNNREVHQPSDVAEAWTNARRENRPVLLRVKRDGQSLFVAVS
ncbi:Do family serine endopeptidase [Bradyrhizobium canariense]|uniref:Do family serine endopeptidase n=1 Tax=Bradyrhizobium canariense TaxID=255045 RepID=UPI000A190EBA|nr:Do family serine endopeptidase [Bradyrhizobium canariense]OSI23689.1 protease Do [Bradyrhizobium canariense]OSI31055.1 protease Do [Bradyrhizobium canariense]OSI39959.1 protease Do [Bradyrhizobium canariense]OSI48249.1 protease Do [Bradyrhizobium canariense]OSI50134.1 protease Do [Bradyrhizobium canariense]